MMYNKDYRYAATRITDTIVMHRGEPAYVRQIDTDDGRTVISDLRGDNQKVVDLEELDVSPQQLGYVNYSGSCAYVVRQPKRRDWRQGLRMSNITSVGGFSIHNIRQEHLKDMLKKNYPTFDRCLLNLNITGQGSSRATKVDIIAWHNNWAVDRRSNVWYKNEVVGVVSEQQPLLNEANQHLIESLRESLL